MKREVYELPGTFQLDFSREPGGSFRLAASQILPLPPPQAFTFFEDHQNLASITPPWLDFRLQDKMGGPVFEGVEFNYTIRWFGLVIPWRSRIADYHPPEEFTDIQVAGPYVEWVHVHTFRGVPEGTLMKDNVRYRLPLGLAGRLMHVWIVERQLRDIFSYRAVRINEWAAKKMG